VSFQTLIDVESLREILAQPDVAVFDCRFDLMNPDAGRNAYLRGHIPRARYADLNRDLSAPVTALSGRHPLPAPDAFAARLSQLGVSNSTQVIAYDDGNGSFAARLWWMLRWLGHGAVAVLDGGFKAWTAQGGALQSGESALEESLSQGALAATTPSSETQSSAARPRIARSRAAAPRAIPPGASLFSARINHAAALGTADLIDGLRDGDITLVDARAPERYAGSIEPIDAVAGHVPGAINHPYTNNLDPSGQFLPPDELRRRWLQRLGGSSPEQVVAMCGSGVTACHNLLALEVAGLPGAKLYAGSWSEWIRDPRRPVARA
jgi:thiosulfate/3-mercaptopyruvate sulfurtransferase